MASRSDGMSARRVEPPLEDCVRLLDRLPMLPVEERLEAVQTLLRTSSPGIRERALRMGAALLDEDRLVEYLRNDEDDVLRNASVEMLKLRRGKSFGVAVGLLGDPDDDVALQAVLILDDIGDPRAVEPLRSALQHRNPNVVQAAIVALGHLGDARTVEDLLPFLDADPWYQLAAVQALGELRSPAAVGPLCRLLPNLMAGSLAAEALARIGGARAFDALARHWLDHRDRLDDETVLGLLAHVLEGLSRPPKLVPGLRETLGRCFDEGETASRQAAARCLLALGPGPEDERALAVLAEGGGDASIVPSCLAHRQDLIGRLLGEQGTARAWGFLLARRFPKDVPLDALRGALAPPLDVNLLEPLVQALERIDSRPIADELLDLYLRSEPEARIALVRVLAKHRKALKAELDRREDLAAEDRLVLEGVLGAAAERIVEGVLALPARDRSRVLGQITDHGAVIDRLPWEQWLEEDPAVYGPIGCEVAVRYRRRELFPVLRRLLESQPAPHLVRVMGELADRESIPILLDLFHEGSDRLRPLVLESLGRIGGLEARQVLLEATGSRDREVVRMAYRALALCATEAEDEVFRRAVAHPDWYVRMACAEVLGRFVRPTNLAALTRLASDPVPAVAQKALASLEA